MHSLLKAKGQMIKMVAVVQLVRASDCGSECRGFESHRPPNKEVLFLDKISIFYAINPHGERIRTSRMIVIKYVFIYTNYT